MIKMILAWVASIYASFIQRQKDEGAKEERDAETQRSNEAKERADVVLAEPRDPDSVDSKLRDGNF